MCPSSQLFIIVRCRFIQPLFNDSSIIEASSSEDSSMTDKYNDSDSPCELMGIPEIHSHKGMKNISFYLS